MVSSSDLGDRPQWSPEFPILLTIPRFPRGTDTHGLLVRSGRPAPMVARVPDPPHDPEIPPRDRHQWSPRHESPCVHPRVRFATTLGPVAVFGPWLGLARSFLEFLVVSWSDLLSLSSSPDRRSWDSPPARGSASGQSRKSATGRMHPFVRSSV